MSSPYLGEIRLLSFAFAPTGWALCNGQLLSISQNQALFSLLGTTYGGDGRTTFGLPDLRARTPRSTDGAHPVGMSGGEAAHTLTTAEIPAHTHTVAAGGTATQSSLSGALWGTTTVPIYTTSAPDAPMNAASLVATGGSQPHDNMPPYLALNFAIATVGIFPTSG